MSSDVAARSTATAEPPAQSRSTGDRGRAIGPGRRHRRRNVDLAGVGIAALTVFTLVLLSIKLVVLVLASVKSGFLLGAGSWGLDNFRSVLGHRAFWEVATNTALVAVGSVLIMTIVAVPLSWLYARTDFPAKGLLAVLMTVQVAVPGFLIALAYVYLLNPTNGLLNQVIRTTTGMTGATFDIYGLGWIIILQGLFMAPAAFFVLVPALQGLDSSLEEGARVLGVRQTTIFFRIILPLMRPAIVSTMVLYGVISLALFDFAATIGVPNRTFVFSTWVFQLTQPASGPPDYGAASALGVIMVLVAGVAVQLYFLSVRRGASQALMTGRRQHQALTELGRRGKTLGWIAVSAFVLITAVVPVFMLVWTSLLPFIQPPSTEALQSLSFDAYRDAFRLVSDVLPTTATIAIAVPTLSVLLALVLSWVATRSRYSQRKLVDVAVMGSVGVPSIVGALAFLYLGLSLYQWIPIYGTVWLLVIAFVARYVSYAQRVISSSMLQIHPELEDAAFTAGVSKGTTMIHIASPMAAAAAAFAWVRIALLSSGELTMALMLQRPGLETLATKIWAMQSGGRTGVAAAMGVIMLLFVSIGVLAFHRQAERFRL